MTPDRLIKAFTATVQSSLHGLRLLKPLLERERDALGGRDPGVLNAAVQDKLAALKELEPSVAARDRLLQASDLPTGIAGGTQFVANQGIPELTHDWDALVDLAGAVADLNDINSQLAAQGQRTARAALGILTGRATGDDTYASLKRPAASVASHSLGKV